MLRVVFLGCRRICYSERTNGKRDDFGHCYEPVVPSGYFRPDRGFPGKRVHAAIANATLFARIPLKPRGADFANRVALREVAMRNTTAIIFVIIIIIIIHLFQRGLE